MRHWNRYDLSKVVAKFAYLIHVDEATLDRTELAVAKVRVGCENVKSIPRELMIVVENQRRKLTLTVLDRIGLPLGPHRTVSITFGESEPSVANGSPVDRGKAIALDEGATPPISPTILAVGPHRRFSWERGQSDGMASRTRQEPNLKEDHYQTH